MSRIDNAQDTQITVCWDGRFMQACLKGGDGSPFAGLDFEGAKIWDPRKAEPGKSACRLLDAPSAQDAMVTIRRVIGQAHANGRPLEGIHAAGAYASAFARHASADDFPANLVGFGPGTTPAGDDWLAGYLTALDLAAGTRLGEGAWPGSRDPGSVAARLRAEEMRVLLAGRLGRTTAAGRALLLGVVGGVPPAYLLEISQAAAAGDATHLEESTVRALEHGATSGEDALAGFAAGLGECFDRQNGW
jgi:hypothetical protein